MVDLRAAPCLRPVIVCYGMLISLGACSLSSEPPDAHLVPEETGFYAVQNDELALRLDGSPAWEQKTWEKRQRLGNDIELVVYDTSIPAAGPDEVQLSRVGWVRSEIDENGDILPADGSRWEAADDADFAVPVQVTHVAARADVLRLTPHVPLADGLYSLTLRTGSGVKRARFGVHWPRVDRRSYASANCLDRYAGSQPSLRKCADQNAGLLTKGLELHLVDPEKKLVDGAPALVVRGVVVNKTDRTRQVPMMEAQLRAADGTVLHRWQFATRADQVNRRGSVPFETVVSSPPASVADVHIRFLPASAMREARR